MLTAQPDNVVILKQEASEQTFFKKIFLSIELVVMRVSLLENLYGYYEMWTYAFEICCFIGFLLCKQGNMFVVHGNTWTVCEFLGQIGWEHI